MEGESIYNLIPPPVPQVVKEPMYRSKYPGVVDPRNFNLGVSKKAMHSTFGPSKEQCKNHAGEYLKKRTGEPTLPEPKAVTMRKQPLKPKVPMKTEKPIMGLVSDKNFLTANAVEIILSKPKKTESEPVRYTTKADYGKVPGYLKTVKGKIAEEKAQIDEYLRMQYEAEKAQSQRVAPISDEERADLLNGLKMKWSEINEKYQKMTFTLDTPAKRQRKERYEEQLQQIEKDIELLNRKNLLVCRAGRL